MRHKITCIGLMALVLTLAVSSSAFADREANREAGREREVKQIQKEFEWWPTDAKPGAVRDEERGGYWWMPTEPGEMRPWGNRGYIYVYKIIFDYQGDGKDLKPNELRPSLLIRKIEKNIKIYFDYDSPVLRPDATRILQKALRTLEKNPELSILITGNADVRGPEQYNLHLAKDRADAVRQFILKNGVSDERIRTVSHGKLNAVAPVTDLEGMQRDRNAQFMIADVEEIMIPYQSKDWPQAAKKIDEDKFAIEEKQVIESDIKVSTRTYEVQDGDTLSNIAEKELGSASRWEYLFEINKDVIGHPDRLRSGQILTIPVE